MTEVPACELDGCGESRAPLGCMPPRYGWALLGLGAAAHFALGAAPVLHLPVVGVGLALVGLWMAVGSKHRFRRAGLAIAPGAPPTGLLADGWFGVSRNPMYVGIAAVLAGVGLVLGSLPALLPAPLFLLLVRRWFVPGEEDRMAATFGAGWERYARRVPRWL